MATFGRMPTLYTYCIPRDNGAGPNPFWGVCTLVICKPQIRRSARIGDWVVGTGSKHSPIGDISGRVVFAMRVTDKVPMMEYDALTRAKYPNKVPDISSGDWRRRLGDSLYDFSRGAPRQRRGVHAPEHMGTDLDGEYALLSDHFFYFGSKPVALPAELMPIVRQGQGHQSTKNDPYVRRFVDWIHGLGCRPNTVLADPQRKRYFEPAPAERNLEQVCLQARRDDCLGASTMSTTR